MEWNVLVIKFWVLLRGSRVTVLRLGKGRINPLYHQAACRSSTFSVEVLLFSCAEVLFKMQHGDVFCTKRACVLSRNEIREIVMDSNSSEDKYYISEGSEDKEEPCPPFSTVPQFAATKSRLFRHQL